MDKLDYPVPELNVRISFIHALIAKQGFHFARPEKRTIKKAISWDDVVQVETPFPVSWRSAKIAKKMDKPTIGTFHIYPQNITSSLPFLNNRLVNWLFMLFFREKSFKNCDALQCPTPKVAKWLRKNHFKQQLFVVSNGISPQFINNSHKKEVGHPFTILCIGRFYHEKRQETLFKAMHLAKHAAQIRLIFAGQGPLQKKYEKMADELSNKSIIQFFTPEKLRQVMAKSDLVVHCADVEIEGMAYMEAFASGCVPVIADGPLTSTSSYALSEYNSFPVGDAQALANRIDYWFDHPQELRLMRQNYRDYGRHLSVANSAKAALGNLKQLYLKY